MTIAINTPTGNIGRRVARILRDAGESLILMARHPEKISDLEGDNVEIAVGDLSDSAFVTAATRQADALFWLTPPSYTASDMRAFQNEVGRHAAAAITANGIARVVNISSIGAQHAEGTGPIAGLHDVEGHLDKTDAAVTHLRPGFFMENYFMMLEPIFSDGIVPMPSAGGTEIEMIATTDIAAEAARLLHDTNWSGKQIIELAGPEPLTFDRAAAIIGDALGREVNHVETSDEQAHEALVGMGLPPATADLMVEMQRAFDTGYVSLVGEPRRTKTTLAQFARNDLMKAASAES